MTVKVLLADDQGLVRAGLRILVDSADDLEVVGEAGTAAEALARIRRQLRDGTGRATTAGYGPRFLHSTGQLHKGGPPTGWFLQFTSDHQTDREIPGWPYTFGQLIDAQAAGDFAAIEAHDLPILVANCKPGTKVPVGLIRDGKPMTVTVTLAAMPNESKKQANGQGDQGQKIQLGLGLQNLTPDVRESLHARVKHGVVVEQVMPGMPAARAGIQQGDVIYRINGKDVKDVRQFIGMAKHFKPGAELRIMLDRSGDQVFALVILPEAKKSN